MKVIELCSGTESFSRVARESFGFDTFTVDIKEKFEPDLVKDVKKMDPEEVPFYPDIVWASPPCDTYSVASLSTHRNGIKPKTDKARERDRLVKKILSLIRDWNPKYWIIENPRGMLRKMPFMEGIPRVTVSYCQYGAYHMKPTDLFGELPDSFDARLCENGATCHIPASRGSKTGTQGLDTQEDRFKVPKKLCWEILNSIRKEIR